LVWVETVRLLLVILDKSRQTTAKNPASSHLILKENLIIYSWLSRQWRQLKYSWWLSQSHIVVTFDIKINNSFIFHMIRKQLLATTTTTT